jgi:hypothetical protein
MGLSLYAIDQAVLTVLENGLVFDEETGEVLFDEDNFTSLEGARNDKLEAVALYVKQLEAEAAAVRAEEKTLAARRQAKERKAERLREYVARSMQAFGDVKLETARCALSFRKSETVELTDPERVPTTFVSYQPKIDKAAIRKALKAGEDVQGAELVTRQNLQIK